MCIGGGGDCPIVDAGWVKGWPTQVEFKDAATASSQGPAREETPLLEKQLSREYNFTSQGDRDQALRMGAELFGGGFSDGFIAGAKSVVAAPQLEKENDNATK